MSIPDIIRSLVDLALIVIAIFLMFNDKKIAAWERRTVRKLLRWAVKNIPAFRAWLYGEGNAEHMPVRLINDWRNSNVRK